MLPRKNQTADQYFAECADLAGENLARANAEEIEQLKTKGYRVQDCSAYSDEYAGMFQWLHDETGEFQDEEPSYSEADCWALVKARELSV